MRTLKKRIVFLYLLLGIFIIVNHYAAYKSDITKSFDYIVYDITTNLLKGHDYKDRESNVVVVDIDEKSLNTLGQWPWPRIVVAKLIDKINNMNPSTIAIDIIFPEKDRTSPIEISSFYKDFFNIDTSLSEIPTKLQDNDIILSDILKKSKSVMSVYLSKDNISNNNCENINSMDADLNHLELEYSQYLLCNTSKLKTSSKYYGFINTTIDSDGILRRMPLLRNYKYNIIPTLSLATLLNIDADFKIIDDNNFELLNHNIQTDKHTNVLLNFYDNIWYKKISALDVLNEKIPKDMLTGKIVLIGSSAAALHDQVVVTGGEKTVGVKVHVTTIDNILHDELLVQPIYFQQINSFISLLINILLFYLLVTKHNNLILFLFVITLVSSVVATMVNFDSGVYISIGYLLAPFLVHFFVISVLYIIIDTYERRIFSEELNRSHVALLDSMVHVAEVHDIETGAHIIRTKKYIKLLAEHLYSKGIYTKLLSPNSIEMMYRTAPLHDLGKVGIADSILKKKGKLTSSEYEVMKTHSELGGQIINNAILSYKENDFFVMAKNIAQYHHEKWDGSGYPEGLKGNNIPIEARLMAIADVYDALVSRRVYKEPFAYTKTIEIIIDGRGKHFDPVLVDAFLEIQGRFRDIAETYSDNS
ncbi:CHASE2 domain-containing protein [Sulfurimonas sp.]|uniref:CHASE2 domain-containing protein n=1 Tax=Sulfurimonas sp. TaxID=2022749 RepID=UPI003567DFDB